MARQKTPEKDERIVDLLERLGVALLYVGANMGGNDIAKALGMGNDRVNKITKNLKKK